MEQKKIDRINELTAISRERELTDAEKSEREALRNEYRAGFRRNMTATLDSTYVVDANGNKTKVQKIQGN